MAALSAGFGMLALKVVVQANVQSENAGDSIGEERRGLLLMALHVKQADPMISVRLRIYGDLRKESLRPVLAEPVICAHNAFRLRASKNGHCAGSSFAVLVFSAYRSPRSVHSDLDHFGSMRSGDSNSI